MYNLNPTPVSKRIPFPAKYHRMLSLTLCAQTYRDCGREARNLSLRDSMLEVSQD